MIIVNLKGGLGNQMFQYALGRALAIKNNDTLKLDLSALKNATAIGNIHRQYGLDAFSLTATVASSDEIAAIKPAPSLATTVLIKIKTRIFGDATVRFDPAILAQTGNVYLDGYWQSPRYFDAIRDTLLQEFTLATPLSGAAAEFLKQIKISNSVSIHIRRGDYAKNPRVMKEFGLCSTEYYISAIDKIKETVDNPVFFVFSDDIAWVRENLPIGDSAVFIQGEGLTDKIELILMSQCQHNIIANSSFSWWGAWLNQNPGKLVIAPTPWFDTALYDTDLIPPSWIQLPK